MGVWCEFLFEGLKRVEKVWSDDCKTGLKSQSVKRVALGHQLRLHGISSFFDTDNTGQESLVKQHSTIIDFE